MSMVIVTYITSLVPDVWHSASLKKSVFEIAGFLLSVRLLIMNTVKAKNQEILLQLLFAFSHTIWNTYKAIYAVYNVNYVSIYHLILYFS